MATKIYANATGVIDGTFANDLISIGIATNATIRGLAGDDNIRIGTSINSTIDGGDGNDTIVVLSSAQGTSSIIGGLGNDIISAKAGHFSIYGDEGDTISPVPLYLFFNQASFSNQIVTFTAPTPTFGNDTITGSSGNDFISGDSGRVENQISFHTSHTSDNQQQTMLFELTLTNVQFGNDTIFAGAGNDVINGDADTSPGFTLAPGSTLGATAIADGVNSQATAVFYSDKNSFNFGADKIFGGDGNDVINGDLSVDAHEVAFGVATASQGGKATSIFATSEDVISYGNDTISGGNGSDTIYGDGKLNSHVAQGGLATALDVGSISTVIDIIGIDVHDHVTPVALRNVAGNDIINGDAGDDIIYGDHKIYYNEAHGGTALSLFGGAASTSYIVDGTVVTFGNDGLFGGDGNDKIVGDVLSTELKVISGTAIGAGASSVVEIKNFTQVMGDDTISGGNGKDVIIGDSLIYNMGYSGLIVSTVAGDLRVTDSHNNSITWGNDVILGGNGNDNFVTVLGLSTDPMPVLVAQGFDVIKDFNLKDDTLTFIGTDMTTFLSHASLAYNGPDTIINFDNGAGGSITLQNVHVNNFSALHMDLLTNPSTLVAIFP